MNILIVYSHPSKKSYTFQILGQLKEMFENQNWNIEISDLYAMNFLTDMTEQEYEREGFAKTEIPISKDVNEEHSKIEKADCIVFLYPVWWSDCPAKLKGWFDRVYSVGYAYGHKPKLQKMKTLKYGVVICTAGHPNDFLNEIGIAQSMQTVMLDDRLGKRFENKEMLLLGGTLDIEKVRQKHKKQIEELIIKIQNYCA
ncbi:MAG: NAD(P)H-dependent oxidoreductase [Saprospiraceae bacterium]|nr:NAD(P)H-dependent oxidoreductase [Saprospiraceae bacterium]MBK6667359.1 NAD(P)H-dependent oxidoreductase [Saprospiraceae bacterium]MBK7698010.1 NAD(P)H-dependent oxidoreductase [Saprospiraceae bacterium]MBK8825253.1 NAD(P)H-dependent oxidoreductase [Saprospiraceae bacterium]MBK8888186.1 NAD(P)H-dependent oxidoreductase [Saprospiraceae bacterium]